MTFRSQAILGQSKESQCLSIRKMMNNPGCQDQIETLESGNCLLIQRRAKEMSSLSVLLSGRVDQFGINIEPNIFYRGHFGQKIAGAAANIQNAVPLLGLKISPDKEMTSISTNQSLSETVYEWNTKNCFNIGECHCSLIAGRAMRRQSNLWFQGSVPSLLGKVL